MTAEESLKDKCLPTGLTDKTKVVRLVEKDTIIPHDDGVIDKTLFSYNIRKSIEKGEY